MSKVVLIVDSNSARRNALCHALSAAAIPFATAPSIFQGIASIGRADFGALVAAEGRPASMRGLCRLARKRHAGIHILAMLRPGSSAENVRAAVGLGVDTVAGNLPPEKLVDVVKAALAAPAPIDFDSLNTAMVQLDVAAALAEEQASPPDDDGDVFAAAPDEPADELQAEMPLLEGSLDDEGGGSALLMGLFAQDLTGRLFVSAGVGRGLLYFLWGEPVWAVHADGDAGLFAQLGKQGVVHAKLPRPAVDEGQLGAFLVQQRHVTGEALHRVMHQMIRERVTALSGQKTGNYRFTEDRAFIDTVPLLKVNPFGVILESCRRSMSPDRLLVIGSEMEGHYLVPGPALAQAAPKLAAFVRGKDVSQILDGAATTVGTFYERTGLDLLMGALVVLVMVESGLATLSDRPIGLAGQVQLTETAQGAVWEGDADLEVVDVDIGFDDEAAGYDELVNMYMQLKPLASASSVLGVSDGANRTAIDEAYRKRMKVLDPMRVPVGSAQSLMRGRVEELRRKVQNAYQAMTGARPA